MTAGVVTGEAVALDVRLAHWPSRMVAKALDLAVQYGLLFITTLVVVPALGSASDIDLVAASLVIVLVLVGFGYPIAFETLWQGRTLGKAAMGLRVVRDDGGPIRFRHALARGLLLPFEIWGPALLVSILSSRSKRIGDMLAGTVVVQTRVPSGRTTPVLMPPPLAGWAQGLDLSGLSDDLALATRRFLDRQRDLAPATREAMGRQLVAAVHAVVTPPAPAGTPGWAYLAAVVAERRRREEWRLHAARTAGRPVAAPVPAQPPVRAQPLVPAEPALPAQPATDPAPGPFAPPV